MDFTFKAIGIIHSCYKEKFGIPRQAGLIAEAPATLVFDPEFAKSDAVKELETFSHLWLVFVFHQAITENWPVMVRPPRLGGNRKVGVFASRSPFRPNPIGLSAVALEKIEIRDNAPVLHIRGADLLDQTPVLDIKPYLPYSDIIQTAMGGYALKAPKPVFSVVFSDEAEITCRIKEEKFPDIRAVIVKMLENDPRPAYYGQAKPSDDSVFGIRIFDVDVKWSVKARTVFVHALSPLE
jgi:tRNA-Thr(GGU) m(6)t(6)A37 methyltransferase TsaA